MTLRLYEGMIFTPESIPECTLVEIIHRSITRIHPDDDYLIPISLHHNMISDNHCVHEGDMSVMTVNYIQTYRSRGDKGVLVHREFQDVEITKQQVLVTRVYRIHPPFRIEEYFDGIFLFLRFTELFNDNEIEYQMYSENNERMENMNSIYKIYPTRGCIPEYIAFGGKFIYRFISRAVTTYPFTFRYWISSGEVYFTSGSKNEVMRIECPDVIVSDTSQGLVRIGMNEFKKAGCVLHVGKHRIAFCVDFHRDHVNDGSHTDRIPDESHIDHVNDGILGEENPGWRE